LIISPRDSLCPDQLSLMPHEMQYGPKLTSLPRSFTPRLRYSGASLGYQLASVVAGGPVTLITTALFATYHTGYAIAIGSPTATRARLCRQGLSRPPDDKSAAHLHLGPEAGCLRCAAAPPSKL
jgi:hypothetical protein